MARQANVEASIPLASMATDPMPSPLHDSSVTTINTTIPAPEITESSAHENKPLVISKSLQQMLPALRAQKPHYITAHVHSFPYLLTEGDTLRLPFHMKGVNPGDVLRFNRATLFGSRDFTLKAGTATSAASNPQHVRGEQFINKRRTGEPSYIDERLFECRMRVVGLDSTPMMVTEKKKRRNRRTRTVRSKHKFTVLKVMEVRLKSLEEIMQADGVQVVLE